MSTYLGQNFLADQWIRSYIAAAIEKLYNQLSTIALLEIGPGKGAITRKIFDISEHFRVIEKDTSMEQYLLPIVSREQIVRWDVLQVDVQSLLSSAHIDSCHTLVVWNLPYYITSPIVRKFFGSGLQDYAGGIFMMQKEVGDKLRSDAKKKSYLWWLVNYSYEVRYLKTVPAKAFRPAPKVASCLLAFYQKQPPWPVDFNRLLDFLEVFAAHSRKTLGKIAKMKNSSYHIASDIAHKRLEELSIDDLVNILSP
jgi:16S rRNA (adenine1518-N6/adenine1519-N6)-dimethyltransferase